MLNQESKIVFPEHFGFCGGVAAADQLMSAVALEAAGRVAVVGLHHIVHNRDVVQKHEANGVQFVDEVDAIPERSAVVISAHGVGPEVKHQILANGSEIFDATCPLVVHTHKGVEHAREHGEKVIYVCQGKPGEVEKMHDEVAGFVGCLDYRADVEGEVILDPIDRSYIELHEDLAQVDGLLTENAKYRIITQTTLHADHCLAYREEIKRYIQGLQPHAEVSWARKGDVCHAVADRQRGVEQLVEIKPRHIIVATDPTSKNGRGYVDLAQKLVAKAGISAEVHAIANATEAQDLAGAEGLIAMTASASTPDEIVTEITQSIGNCDPPEQKDQTFNLRDAKQITAKLRKLGR